MNYNELFNEYPHKGTLLLHVCCAPCSCGVLPRLDGFKVIPYFYNPNIDTLDEYELRAEQFSKLGVEPIIEKYDHGEFLREIAGLESEPEGGERCKLCIAMRLRQTAVMAAKMKTDCFCSTLSVSPHKNAEYINEVGEALQKQYGVKFLPNDFKKQNGFLNSTKISKELGIYRQNYCGCEFARGLYGRV